jgi:hypothetical protein
MKTFALAVLAVAVVSTIAHANTAAPARKVSDVFAEQK